MFADRTMMEAVGYTILVAVVATIVSTVIGTLAAIGLSRPRKLLRNVVEQVNNLPVMNPEIVTAIGLLMFFSSLGVKKGLTTMLLAHIMFCIPYVILSVSPKLRSLDPNLADAALEPGRYPLQAPDQGHCAADHAGMQFRCADCFHHELRSLCDFLLCHRQWCKQYIHSGLHDEQACESVDQCPLALVLALITITLIIVNVVPMIREKRRTKA